MTVAPSTRRSIEPRKSAADQKRTVLFFTGADDPETRAAALTPTYGKYGITVLPVPLCSDQEPAIPYHGVLFDLEAGDTKDWQARQETYKGLPMLGIYGKDPDALETLHLPAFGSDEQAIQASARFLSSCFRGVGPSKRTP